MSKHDETVKLLKVFIKFRRAGIFGIILVLFKKPALKIYKMR